MQKIVQKIVSMGIVLLLSVSASVLAQENSTLSGVVTDTTGAFIPGAEVTAVQDATGMATTRVTDAIGKYEFALQPGLYTLTAEMPGFQADTRNNVELMPGQPVQMSFTLEISTLNTALVVVGSRAKPAIGHQVGRAGRCHPD